MMTVHASDLLVSFGGHTLKVVSDSPQIASAMQNHLRHCSTREHPGEQADLIAVFHVIASNASMFTASVDGSDLSPNLGYDLTLQTLMTELISRLVAVCERGLVIHAAALAHDGDAVILSGRTSSGKSSLAARLTADGLQYMTDEVIEMPLAGQEGRVNGLTRSIFLKRGSSFIWRNCLPPIDSLQFLRFADDAAWVDPQFFHPNPPVSTATPRLLVFPCYVPDSPLRAEKLTTAETLFRILQNLTNARNLPRHGMDGAAQLARQVTAYTLAYSNLESASEWIRNVFQAG